MVREAALPQQAALTRRSRRAGLAGQDHGERTWQRQRATQRPANFGEGQERRVETRAARESDGTLGAAGSTAETEERRVLEEMGDGGTDVGRQPGKNGWTETAGGQRDIRVVLDFAVRVQEGHVGLTAVLGNAGQDYEVDAIDGEDGAGHRERDGRRLSRE